MAVETPEKEIKAEPLQQKVRSFLFFMLLFSIHCQNTPLFSSRNYHVCSRAFLYNAWKQKSKLEALGFVFLVLFGSGKRLNVKFLLGLLLFLPFYFLISLQIQLTSHNNFRRNERHCSVECIA